MSLLESSEAYLATTLEDPDYFGVPIKITKPGGGVEYNISGQYNHIGRSIDPDTGLSIIGEAASITVRASSLVGEQPGRDWSVEVTDTNGVSRTMYISDQSRDNTLGVITYFLRY